MKERHNRTASLETQDARSSIFNPESFIPFCLLGFLLLFFPPEHICLYYVSTLYADFKNKPVYAHNIVVFFKSVCPSIYPPIHPFTQKEWSTPALVRLKIVTKGPIYRVFLKPYLVGLRITDVSVRLESSSSEFLSVRLEPLCASKNP